MNWLVGVRAKPASARTSNGTEGVYDAALWRQATIDSLRKFDPRTQIRNPVMFVVWLGAIVTAALTINPALFGPSDASSTYNGVVTIILLFTVWFANFAEALAECRGKVKAASLRRTKEELTATRVAPPVRRTGACRRAAQRRPRPYRAKRGHSSGRRRRRRRRLCERIGHNRRIRSGPETAWHGHVFDCHGGHAVNFGSAGCSRRR